MFTIITSDVSRRGLQIIIKLPFHTVIMNPTFVEPYPAMSLCDKVFPRRVHHLGEVKDRHSALWVRRRAVLC